MVPVQHGRHGIPAPAVAEQHDRQPRKRRVGTLCIRLHVVEHLVERDRRLGEADRGVAFAFPAADVVVCEHLPAVVDQVHDQRQVVLMLRPDAMCEHDQPFVVVLGPVDVALHFVAARLHSHRHAVVVFVDVVVDE